MSRRVVLVGAGLAHLHLLQVLARQPQPDVEWTLVTPAPRVVHARMVPGLVAGRFTLADCSIALGPLAQAAGVQLIESAAAGLDAGQRILRLADGRELLYGLLSLNCGAILARDRIPGAREHGLFVRPLDHFSRLLEPLVSLAAERPLDVVVVGGGAAGVEIALALQQRLGAASDRPARVALVTGGLPPLASRSPALQALAADELRRRRVTVFPEPCAALQAGTAVLASGARLACDAPVIATGPQAPAWLSGSGLALDAEGFVSVHETLQSASHPEVLASGDVASCRGALRSSVHAAHAAPVLAANLRRLLAGEPLRPWRVPSRTLDLVACGDGRALAAWGGWAWRGRWAGWWKDRVDRGFVARGGRLTRV